MLKARRGGRMAHVEAPHLADRRDHAVMPPCQTFEAWEA